MSKHGFPLLLDPQIRHYFASGTQKLLRKTELRELQDQKCKLHGINPFDLAARLLRSICQTPLLTCGMNEQEFVLTLPLGYIEISNIDMNFSNPPQHALSISM